MISRVNVRKVNELTRVIGAADRDGFLELILHLDGHLVGAFATESLANGAISHLKHALIIAEGSQLRIFKFSSMITFDSGYHSTFLNLQFLAQMYHLIRSLSFISQKHNPCISSKIVYNN